MWTSALFDVKNLRFFEIYGVFTRTRRVSQCGHFANKGEGVNFLKFCVDVLYGWPLTVSQSDAYFLYLWRKIRAYRIVLQSLIVIV